MKITQMFNSKFISTFLVLAGMIMSPVTGSATSRTTVHTCSLGAPVFVSKEAGVKVNIDVKKPTVIYSGTRNEKGVFNNTYDHPGFKDGNYVINKYNSKNSGAKSFTITCMDSWETPVSRTGKTL